MLLLIKSVEIAVQSITTTVNSNAAKSGYSISDQQIADIQFRALEQIALGFAANTTDNLAAPAGLRNALEAAITEGIKKINADASGIINKGNVLIDPAAAVSIVDNAVGAAATVLDTTLSSTVPLSASVVQSETALAGASPVYAATFAKALDLLSPAIVKISSLITTSASTPSPYGPANIFIVFVNTIPGTITGSAGTGGSGGGTGGGFKPLL